MSMIKQGDLFTAEEVRRYEVNTYVHAPIPCVTKEQVWRAIGRLPYSRSYWVTSPIGLYCGEFIPY